MYKKGWARIIIGSQVLVLLFSFKTPAKAISTPQWLEMGANSSSGGGISNTATESTLRSLEFSSNGTPLVSWYDETIDNSNVLEFNGDEWNPLGNSGQQGGYLAADSLGNVFTTWYDDSLGGDSEIYVMYFNGNAWLEVGTGSGSGGGISDNAGDSTSPQIALDQNDLPYICWHDDSSGNLEIYVKYFDGLQWEEVGSGSASGGGISGNTGNSYLCRIVIDSFGFPIIVWEDTTDQKDIFGMRFDGNDWVEINSGSASGDGITQSNRAGMGDLAKDADGNLYLAWIDQKSLGNDEDVFILRFDGSQWEEVGLGSASGTGISNDGTTWCGASVAIDNSGNPYVAWAETNGGNFEVYVKSFDGDQWVEVGVGSGSGGGISNTPGSSECATINIGPDDIPIVAWMDRTSGNAEIYVKQYSVLTTPPDGNGDDDDKDGKTFDLTSDGGEYKFGVVKVSVPPNSVADSDGCQLLIGRRSATDENFMLGNEVYLVQIRCDDGLRTSFDLPLKICIKPTGTVLQGTGQDHSLITLFHKHDDDPWEALDTFDEGNYRCSYVSSLSLFALGLPQLPSTGFPPNVITKLPAQPETLTYRGIGELWLEIPSLGVELPIVGVPLTESGWDVTWLSDQAGYLEGTAFPTWVGNTVITAHVWDANNNPGPFSNLHTLTYDDEILIRAWGNTYTYHVIKTSYARPQDIGSIPHKDFDALTLITCQGYDETTGAYEYRIVVQAILVLVTEDS